MLLPNVSRVSFMYLLLRIFQCDHDYTMAAQQTAKLKQVAVHQKEHVEDLRYQLVQLKENENAKQIRYCFYYILFNAFCIK